MQYELFSGQYFDSETGLHYNIVRHHDRGIRRQMPTWSRQQRRARMHVNHLQEQHP